LAITRFGWLEKSSIELRLCLQILAFLLSFLTQDCYFSAFSHGANTDQDFLVSSDLHLSSSDLCLISEICPVVGKDECSEGGK